jgi:hypothetical protein
MSAVRPNPSPKLSPNSGAQTQLEHMMSSLMAEPQSNITPQTYEEALAFSQGEDLAEYRKKAAQRSALWAESNRYTDLPPAQWPDLQFNWDLSLEGRCRTLDGVTPETFQEQYPLGFRLGWVNMAGFDAKLCHFSRRDGVDELWSLGSASRLSYLVAYLAHGLPISPPLVKPLPSGELILQGGHHRYAAAKAKELESIPIYVEQTNVTSVERIVSVRWQDT